MKKYLIVLLLPLSLFAQLKVAVSYPYIGALVDEIGGEYVEVTVLAKGNWDPHFVVPRPSLIAKLRRSDALVMNGGQLEIGWLPPLIRRAANRAVMPNSPSFLNLSHQVDLIQKPQSVDRSLGDVHPDGNPHFHLDPNNIIVLARSISDFLVRIDGDNKEAYKNNLNRFAAEWNTHLKRWSDIMKDKKGMQVIQFHDVLAYFANAYGLSSIGTIEPLPGIPPSSRHTLELINVVKSKGACCILHDVYHSTKTAEFISSKTGVKLIMMPHDVGALESIHSLVELFDYLTKAVCDD